MAVDNETGRTEQELRDHYLDLGPGFIREPDELLDAQIRAVAAVLAAAEQAIAGLHERTYIDVADGSWLDEHGRERGVARREGESDDDYRPRVKEIPDAVTIPAIQAAVDALLAVGQSTLREHLGDGAFTDYIGGVQGFSDVSVAYDGLRCFTVIISEQLLNRNDTAYAGDPAALPDVTAFAGDGVALPDVTAFADGVDPTPSDVYSTIYQTIDRLRAAGVTFRVEVGS